MTVLQTAGLSHSEICGSQDICSYPQLIAAYHVLHRLQEPRHPPYALSYFVTRSPSRLLSKGGLLIRRSFAYDVIPFLLLVVRSSYQKLLSDKALCVYIMSNIAFHLDKNPIWNRGE